MLNEKEIILQEQNYLGESPLMSLGEAAVFFRFEDSMSEVQKRRKFHNWKKNERLPEDVFKRLGRPLYFVKSKLYRHILKNDCFKFKTVTLLRPDELADFLDIPKNIKKELKEDRVMNLYYKGKLPEEITFEVGDDRYFIKEKFDEYINQ